jgi:hypothetical protein
VLATIVAIAAITPNSSRNRTRIDRFRTGAGPGDRFCDWDCVDGVAFVEAPTLPVLFFLFPFFRLTESAPVLCDYFCALVGAVALIVAIFISDVTVFSGRAETALGYVPKHTKIGEVYLPKNVAITEAASEKYRLSSAVEATQLEIGEGFTSPFLVGINFLSEKPFPRFLLIHDIGARHRLLDTLASGVGHLDPRCPRAMINWRLAYVLKSRANFWNFPYDDWIGSGRADDYVSAQTSLFGIASYPRLVGSASGSEYCYDKRYFFKQSMIAHISLGGADSLICGIWIIFYGIDRRNWRSGRRLCAALVLSCCLIVTGWFTQAAVLPLPSALFAEYAAAFCGGGSLPHPLYPRTRLIICSTWAIGVSCWMP